MGIVGLQGGALARVLIGSVGLAFAAGCAASTPDEDRTAEFALEAPACTDALFAGAEPLAGAPPDASTVPSGIASFNGARLRRLVQVLSSECTENPADPFLSGQCRRVEASGGCASACTTPGYPTPLSRWAPVSNRTRAYATVETIQRAFARAAADVGLTDYTASVQPFVRGGMVENWNLLVRLPGARSDGKAIVVGAHHDSINNRDTNPEAPGANDDASGIAVLVEVFRALASMPRLDRDVIFAAFGAEEQGRYGSRAYVQSLPRRAQGGACPAADPSFPCVEDIVGMIQLDIVGLPRSAAGAASDPHASPADWVRVFASPATAGPGVEVGDSASQLWARSIDIAARSAQGGAPSFHVVTMPALDREGRFSDHASFSELGVPAVRFIASKEDASVQHSSRDRVVSPAGDEMIDWGYVERVAHVVFAAARDAATIVTGGRFPRVTPEGALDFAEASGTFQFALREGSSHAIARTVTCTASGVGRHGSNVVSLPASVRSIMVRAVEPGGRLGLPHEVYLRECRIMGAAGIPLTSSTTHCHDE